MTLIALVHMSLDVLAEAGYLNKCRHPGGAFNVVSSAKVAANLEYTARLTKAGGAESVMNKHSATTNSESMTRLIDKSGDLWESPKFFGDLYKSLNF